MPILKVQLDTARYSEAQRSDFLQQVSVTFAEVLEAPVDRIRVYLIDVPASNAAIGGVVAAPEDAPFYEFYLLAGRPPEHRTRLLAAIADLLESCLGVNRSLIRGLCWHIDPEDWGIAGVPAAAKRASEIEERKNQIVQ